MSFTYSEAEKFLHRLAFRTPVISNILSKIENVFFPKYKVIEVREPIFVCAVPRAGTTIILEELSKIKNLKSFTYRDMPFIRNNIIWRKIRSVLQLNKTNSKERFHADSIKISIDSPEAFEEPLWVNHKLDTNSIKKLIYPTQFRYLSKNNNNIQRIQKIRSIFNDAKIIIPFRDPISQSSSLLKQQLSFERLHKEDSFSQEYMTDLGHVEFGEIHRKYNISRNSSQYKLHDINYWLELWVDCYSTLISENVMLYSHERLCEEPIKNYQKILNVLNIQSEPTEKTVSITQQKNKSDLLEHSIDEKLYKEAYDLHNNLLDRCFLSEKI